MNLVLGKLKESRSLSAFKLSKTWNLNAIVAGFARTVYKQSDYPVFILFHTVFLFYIRRILVLYFSYTKFIAIVVVQIFLKHFVNTIKMIDTYDKNYSSPGKEASIVISYNKFFFFFLVKFLIQASILVAVQLSKFYFVNISF